MRTRTNPAVIVTNCWTRCGPSYVSTRATPLIASTAFTSTSKPQQRPENKGVGNLQFLPGLVDAYRGVRSLAEPAHLMVNADIQKKLLKGEAAQRKLLLSSLPRLTLMLYELSSPGDRESEQKKIEKLQTESQKFLDTAYDGLQSTGLAKMV